jgi:hypothetical protein
LLLRAAERKPASARIVTPIDFRPRAGTGRGRVRFAVHGCVAGRVSRRVVGAAGRPRGAELLSVSLLRLELSPPMSDGNHTLARIVAAGRSNGNHTLARIVTAGRLNGHGTVVIRGRHPHRFPAARLERKGEGPFCGPCVCRGQGAPSDVQTARRARQGSRGVTVECGIGGGHGGDVRGEVAHHRGFRARKRV